MAKEGQDVRPETTFACTEHEKREYIIKKNRNNDPDWIGLKKYCPRCRTHRAYRETR